MVIRTRLVKFRYGGSMNNDKVVIFVFGSNLAGRHGKGAALTAFKLHGAIRGCGEGLQGSSYAIPTKDYNIKRLSLNEIHRHVNIFIEVAKSLPNKMFYVTAIGTGLAGYTKEEIAPFFKGAPTNCNLPEGWRNEN